MPRWNDLLREVAHLFLAGQGGMRMAVKVNEYRICTSLHDSGCRYGGVDPAGEKAGDLSRRSGGEATRSPDPVEGKETVVVDEKEVQGKLGFFQPDRPPRFLLDVFPDDFVGLGGGERKLLVGSP